MGSVADWEEERSVIGDKGDIGNVDFANNSSSYNYNYQEGPIIISVPFPLQHGKPRSVGMGETVVHPITIENTTSEEVDLWSVEIYDSKPKDSFTLSLMQPPTETSDEDYKRSFIESFSLEDRMLRPKQTLTIWLSCKTEVKGLHTTAVHFAVGDETIERMAFIMAESKISLSLASNKPYNRPRRNRALVPSVLSVSENKAVGKYVRGSRPAKASLREFRYKLPTYPIPQTIRDIIENKGIPDCILEGLTVSNYVSFFKTLVIMEELKIEEDMRGYDMDCIYMKRKGSFLILEVPGLAERRPSLVIGDYIFAKISSDVGNDNSSAYQGYIHRVEAEEVFLKFDDAFHESYCAGNQYNVQFAYNRMNMRRLYQAIEATEQLELELRFPSESSKKRVIKASPLVPLTTLLNEEQMNAVERILGCQGGPPYVIHGPPGTGKTVTLTEAILQVYATQKNGRLLICAPSNSAADHILDKILSEKSVKIDEGEIFRLNAQTRRVDDINPEYQKFCYIDEQEMVFKCPLFEDLTRYRIIISTYTSSSLLYAEGIPRGHFSHIFLDEAGQASEPETMIPLSHLSGRKTVVVLAGDPMQLGPIVFSKGAETNGLGKSYLERLFEYDFYRNGNQNYVTKLIRNYRCHPEILYLPSQLFYDGELIPCKVDDNRAGATWFDILPDKNFPMLFIGVQGVDEREGSNPSWFNRIEASEVVEMVQTLIEKGLSKEDIGVITPYRQQVLKIQRALEENVGPDVKVGTVEQFQGQEKEVIIISTVRSTIKHHEFDRIHYLGFLSNPRRFNVAITRARSLLIAVGNPHIICKDQYWNQLLWRCSDNGSYQGCFLPNKEEIPDVEEQEEFTPYRDQGQWNEEGTNNFQPSEGQWNDGPSEGQWNGPSEGQWNDAGTNNFQPSEGQWNDGPSEGQWNDAGANNFQPSEGQWNDEGTNNFTPSEDVEWV